MTHYSWTIQTAEDAAAGDLRPVYLSLHGLSATTEEIALPTLTYGPGSVASGVLDVERDLGELQSGTLRTDESAALWSVGWVRVVNLSDGRQWTARGGLCDAAGSCPLLRFARTRDALVVRKINGDSGSGAGAGDSTSWQDTLPVEEMPRGAPAIARTYEIFGTHRGRVVPLTQILRITSGVKRLLPGSRILIAADESQGFGLAGAPGMWEDLYPGVDPAVYGLDPDKPVLASDGSCGWVLDAHYLAMLFGAGWRRVVYGN